MNLFFSFIIPVYNRPDEIRELLDSLAVQTYPNVFEVVIIEDGSTVPSERIIKDFQSKHWQVDQPQSQGSPGKELRGQDLQAQGSKAGKLEIDTQARSSQTRSPQAGQLQYKARFSINYLKKPNSGPGSSRNYGMARAQGNYFIVLDSDCMVPPRYLETVAGSLRENFVHCYGGPDAAHDTFSLVQKAISYAMTAVLTTGGIRGGTVLPNKPSENQGAPGGRSKPAAGQGKSKSSATDSASNKGIKSATRQRAFQPRSFNMGLSKSAFEATGGFGNIHPGEDPDLVFRLWAQGFRTRLIPEAFVFHKRRVDWQKFYVQVKKFGMVRPILNRRYPKTAKMTYWFPSFFCLGFLVALVFWYSGIVLPIMLYAIYFGLIFLDSLLKNGSLSIAILSMVAVVIQFMGYGFGFLKSSIFVNFSKKNPEELFPKLFFKEAQTETRI